MTFDEKNIENNDKLTQGEKDALNKLFHDISNSIKNKENRSIQKTDIDEKIGKLASRISTLETQKQANELLEDLKKELQSINEYNEYKDLVAELEKKVEEFKKSVISNAQKKLAYLERLINGGNKNLTPEGIKVAANEGRRRSKESLEKIVYELSKKGGLLGKLAQLANGKGNSKIG